MADTTVEGLTDIAGGSPAGIQTTDLIYVFRPGSPDLDFKADGQDIKDFVLGTTTPAPPMQMTKTTVPSASILTLNATPYTIVAAPGAGKVIVIEGAYFYKPAGTAYAGIAAGEDLAIRYTNASGSFICGQEITGFLDQATAQRRYGQAYGPLLATVEPQVNAPLVLHMASGEITTGDSDLIVTTMYRVLDTSVVEA